MDLTNNTNGTKGNGVMKTPLGEFIIGKTLGEGSYGKVKLLINSKTNEKLAVKIVKRFVAPDPTTGNKGRGGKTFEQRILREANLTRFLVHKNIVGLKDCRITKTHFYLFYTFVNGCQLTDKIGRNGLSLDVALNYFVQIISGIGYCHNNFVVHRDIKVENIMVDANDSIQIIDFGLANFFDVKHNLKTFCGSLQYSAPEIMRGDPYIGPEVDIWSIGVVLFAMLTGTLPFDDPRNPGAWECVMNGKIRWTPNFPQAAKPLVTRLLDPNPQRRITMLEIFADPLLSKFKLDNAFKPSKYRMMPKVLDKSIVNELTACMFQSELTIVQQLEAELKIGKVQKEGIMVNNVPLVALYHLILNSRIANDHKLKKTEPNNNFKEGKTDNEPVVASNRITPRLLSKLQPKEQKDTVGNEDRDTSMRRNLTETNPGVEIKLNTNGRLNRVQSENGTTTNSNNRPPNDDDEDDVPSDLAERLNTNSNNEVNDSSNYELPKRPLSRRKTTINNNRQLNDDDDDTNDAIPSDLAEKVNNKLNDNNYDLPKRSLARRKTVKKRPDSQLLPDTEYATQLPPEFESTGDERSILEGKVAKGVVGEPMDRSDSNFSSRSNRSTNSSNFENSIDKLSYQKKRVSMYETYKRLNLDFDFGRNGKDSTSLDEEQRKLDYRAKRASLFETTKERKVYDRPKSAMETRPPTTNYHQTDDDEVVSDSELNTTKQSGKGDTLVDRLPKLNRTTTVKQPKDNNDRTETYNSRRDQIRNKLKQHFGSTKVTTSNIPQLTVDRLSSLSGSLARRENLLNKEMKAKVVESTELKSPFFTTSPKVLSPVKDTKPAVSNNSSNRPTSNQKKYLDQLLASYKAKAEANRNNNSNEVSGGSGKPLPTIVVKPKKKVTFLDPLETEIEPNPTVINQVNNEDAIPKVKIENKPTIDASLIFNKLKELNVDSDSNSNLSDDTDDNSNDNTGEYKLESKNQQFDFKTKTVNFNLAKDLTKLDRLPTVNPTKQTIVNFVKVDTERKINPVQPTKIEVATSPKKDDGNLGIREITIHQCLKLDTLIKTSKLSVNELSDQYMDLWLMKDWEFDWSSVGLNFLVKVPVNQISGLKEVIGKYGDDSDQVEVEVEFVQISKVKSSAVLINNCYLNGKVCEGTKANMIVVQCFKRI